MKHVISASISETIKAVRRTIQFIRRQPVIKCNYLMMYEVNLNNSHQFIAAPIIVNVTSFKMNLRTSIEAGAHCPTSWKSVSNVNVPGFEPDD